MHNLFIPLPKDKAREFRALCVASGVAAQIFYAVNSNETRVYPACAPADFEALKELFGETK